MPFLSEAQRRFMWATHPTLAKEWQAKTGAKKLPKKVSTDARKSARRNQA